MTDRNKGPAVKVPKLSPESVTLAFIIISCMHENTELLMRFIQSLLALNDPQDSANELEVTLKKQIQPAAQLTCILPLADKLVLEERSARAAVSFIYILLRLIYQKMGSAKPVPAESKELWKQIWAVARLFPMVEQEWSSADAEGDLRGWQLEIQEHAREKWKYFSKKQLPQLDDRVSELSARMMSMFSSTPGE